METTYSGDTEAAWTIKAKKPYYGYKAHIAVDAEHGFILAGHATPANRADCKEMLAAVNKCGLDKGSPVFADKGYSGAEYRGQLEEAGYFDGIMYKAARNRPLSEPQRLVNRAISRFRGKVERAFGTLKRSPNGQGQVSGSGQGGAATTFGCHGLQSEESRQNGNGIGDRCPPQGGRVHIQPLFGHIKIG